MLKLDPNRKNLYIRWVLIRFCLVIFDIFAVNFAYYFALLVRFYVNFEFNVWAVKFVPAFAQFAPVYTVCCLAVFAFLGLYNSLWKYAGMSDLARIVVSSLITCVIQVVGSIALVMRMPISYYALGAAFQFVLITVSRFSYRVVIIEKNRIFTLKTKGAQNVMIIGTGESVRSVIKHLERDISSKVQPVCVIDFGADAFPGTISGVPVVGGTDRIRYAVKKYKVDHIILADAFIPSRIRRKIGEICKDIGIGFQAFSEYLPGNPCKITAKTLLEHLDGAVELVVDGETISYESAERAQEGLKENYVVVSVCARNDRLQVWLIQDTHLQNAAQAEWIQAYREETGEDVSFF